MLIPGALAAEGAEPKAKAADYPAHSAVGGLEIGAEYMVHSFSGHGQTFIAKDYLTVEVALYTRGADRLELSQGQFTLRLNGRKQMLLPQAPTFVAASLKYPDWEYNRSAEVYAGAGNTGVTIGRPPTVERFPGDPRPGQQRLPRPPQAPEPEDRSGVDKQPPAKAEDVAVAVALPEGDVKPPVSGYLYFAWKGKTTSIKSVELMYTGPAGAVTLKLQ
ncbi:MAG TPA: hypothetical protein VGJ68_16415 [Bradyrhizobium sp.]